MVPISQYSTQVASPIEHEVTASPRQTGVQDIQKITTSQISPSRRVLMADTSKNRNNHPRTQVVICKLARAFLQAVLFALPIGLPSYKSIEGVFNAPHGVIAMTIALESMYLTIGDIQSWLTMDGLPFIL